MSGSSYAAAGVDIAAGDAAVEAMKASVKRTTRPEVIGGLGGFAGLFQLDLAKYRQPILASSTDGVGTKLVIAQALDRHDTIGLDLVAMVVDDLVVVGAEPLFLSDYIATGKVVPERIAAIVSGIAEGCVQAGCSLVGGETAEHPGVMGAGDYDISATGVGIVEADAMLGPERVRPGDVLLALASSGLHSNGYSLVRHVIDAAGVSLSDTPQALGGQRVGDVLLTPTRIYAQDVLAMAGAGAHAFAHITGGGLAANLVRVLPDGIRAIVDRSSWTPLPVFDFIAAAGQVQRAEMEQAFNMGVGMIAVVPAERCADVLAVAAAREVPCWQLGEVVPSEPAPSQTTATGSRADRAKVELRGEYAGVWRG